MTLLSPSPFAPTSGLSIVSPGCAPSGTHNLPHTLIQHRILNTHKHTYVTFHLMFFKRSAIPSYTPILKAKENSCENYALALSSRNNS